MTHKPTHKGIHVQDMRDQLDVVAEQHPGCVVVMDGGSYDRLVATSQHPPKPTPEMIKAARRFILSQSSR